MIAKDLINYMVPPLKLTDKVAKAKLWMDELRLPELPVVDNNRFLGLLDEEILLNDELRYLTVEEYPLIGNECVVFENQHYYEVLKISNIEGFRLVAVVDHLNQYLGVITTEDVVEVFARSSSVSTPGAILMLKLKIQDYSLSEISRIIESNEAKILSSYLAPNEVDPAKVSLTLKINKEDVSQIVSTLENSGYTVESSFNTAAATLDDKERIDILMRYIKT